MNAKTNTKQTSAATSIEVGALVHGPKGNGKVTAVSRGWATVTTEDGEYKARTGDLTPARAGYVKSGKLTYLREAYTKHDTRTASGRKAFDTNDKVAAQLRGLSLDEAYAAAAVWCDVPEKELRAKYAHLNPGMQRMNLGNKMRAA